HLVQVVARDPARGDVEAVRLGAELRIERQGHATLADQEIERVGRVVGPGAVRGDRDQGLESDLADAGRHAPGLARPAVRAQALVPPLDPRIAADAFLAGPGRAAVHDFLVRAALDALAIAPATLLVNQDDAVLGPLVDRLAGAGGQAGGVGAVVADPRQGEEPDAGLGQLRRTAEPAPPPAAAGGRVLGDVRGAPPGLGRQGAEGGLRPFRAAGG